MASASGLRAEQSDRSWEVTLNGSTNGFAFCRNSSTKREGGDYNVLRSFKKNIGRLRNISRDSRLVWCRVLSRGSMFESGNSWEMALNSSTNSFAFCRNSSTKREGGDYNVIRSFKKNTGRLKYISRDSRLVWDSVLSRCSLFQSGNCWEMVLNGGTNGFVFCRNSSTKREGGDNNLLRSLKYNLGTL